MLCFYDLAESALCKYVYDIVVMTELHVVEALRVQDLFVPMTLCCRVGEDQTIRLLLKQFEEQAIFCFGQEVGF